MISYHLSLYVNYSTSYENPAINYQVTSIVPYNHTYKDIHAHTCAQNPGKCPSLPIFTYVICQHA